MANSVKRAILITSMIVFSSAILSSCTLSGMPDVEYVMSNKVNFVDASKWKEGEDCATYVMGIGPFGTRSLVRAAQSKKIRKLQYFETRTDFYLVYWKSCVVAYGR